MSFIWQNKEESEHIGRTQFYSLIHLLNFTDFYIVVRKGNFSIQICFIRQLFVHYKKNPKIAHLCPSKMKAKICGQPCNQHKALHSHCTSICPF